MKDIELKNKPILKLIYYVSWMVSIVSGFFILWALIFLFYISEKDKPNEKEKLTKIYQKIVLVYGLIIMLAFLFRLFFGLMGVIFL